MAFDASAFQHTVRTYYKNSGRDLPWRNTDDEYHIFVSEIMLQQTGVGRVLEKYRPFISKFKSFYDLQAAPRGEILSLWQGLGYNRRLIYMKESAKKVCEKFSGSLPKSEKLLLSLPGVGTATARSLLAFCFNHPVVFLETNIRQVFIHHFFPGEETVHDRALYPWVERTLDHDNPREWYYALMDYGTMLKKLTGNITKRSSGYRRAGPYEGSMRQLRGAVLKLFLSHRNLTVESLTDLAGTTHDRGQEALVQLEREGFLKKEADDYSLRQ